MAIVAAKCTCCGGNINIDNSKDAGICEFCGSPFITEKAINNYNININVSSSSNIDNLYILARRHRDNNNYSDAVSNYNLILNEDPNSWEAYFYHIYFSALQLGKSDVSAASDLIINNLNSFFNLVDESNSENKSEIIAEIVNACIKSITEFYNSVNSVNTKQIAASKDFETMNTMACAVANAASIGYIIGDILDERYSDIEDIKELKIESWENGVKYLCKCYSWLRNKKSASANINKYTKKIKNYKPSYRNNRQSSAFTDIMVGLIVAFVVLFALLGFFLFISS